MSDAKGDMEAAASDVIAIIAKRVPAGRSDIRLDDRLADLGIESIEAVEMIFDLEEKFDVRIPYNVNNAQSDFETVGDIVRAIQKLLASRT